MSGETAVVIVPVESHPQRQLPEIAEAGDRLGLRFGTSQRRQEHAGEDGNDGNHHEKFDEREASADAAFFSPSRVFHGEKRSEFARGLLPEACELLSAACGEWGGSLELPIIVKELPKTAQSLGRFRLESQVGAGNAAQQTTSL
jgi:hypothetical protein